MERKKDYKAKALDKPAPTRRGLRSQSNTPAPDPIPSASVPPKKASRKRKVDKIEEEQEKVDSKRWLENERQKRIARLGTVEGLASISGFDKQLQNRDDARRAKSTAAVTKANRAVGGSEKFDPKERRRRDDKRLHETSLYEDFMYFQCPGRRSQYEQDIHRDTKKPFRKGDKVGRLWLFGADENEELRNIVEDLEERNIGILENIVPDGIGPNDLHILVPSLRREPFGLDEIDLQRATQEVNLSRLNREAIERRRVEIEGDPQTEGTHSARRAREVAAMGDLPTDHKINDIVPTARSMDRTRLQSGLFIAAGEQSRDWLTSYDHLDIVRPGVYAVERHFLDPIDEGYQAARDSAQDEGEGKEEEEEEEDIPQPDNYPGFLNEFSKPPRPHKKFAHRPTTPFAEATYGRCEREHIHMFLAPSSPVDSPPHSPKRSSNIPLDVPSSHPDYEHYRAKFRDNHGLTYKSWPEFKEKGYAMRYEPLDIAALPKELQDQYESNKEVLGDPEILDNPRLFDVPAPDGTSMRLLREAKGMPYTPPIRPAKDKQGPWVEGDSESGSDNSGGDVDLESSDDDGDLFRKAYLEAGSGVVEAHDDGGDGHGGAGDEGFESQGGGAENDLMMVDADEVVVLSDDSHYDDEEEANEQQENQDGYQ